MPRYSLDVDQGDAVDKSVSSPMLASTIELVELSHGDDTTLRVSPSPMEKQAAEASRSGYAASSPAVRASHNDEKHDTDEKHHFVNNGLSGASSGNIQRKTVTFATDVFDSDMSDNSPSMGPSPNPSPSDRRNDARRNVGIHSGGMHDKGVGEVEHASRGTSNIRPPHTQGRLPSLSDSPSASSQAKPPAPSTRSQFNRRARATRLRLSNLASPFTRLAERSQPSRYDDSHVSSGRHADQTSSPLPSLDSSQGNAVFHQSPVASPAHNMPSQVRGGHRQIARLSARLSDVPPLSHEDVSHSSKIYYSKMEDRACRDMFGSMDEFEDVTMHFDNITPADATSNLHEHDFHVNDTISVN